MYYYAEAKDIICESVNLKGIVYKLIASCEPTLTDQRQMLAQHKIVVNSGSKITQAQSSAQRAPKLREAKRANWPYFNVE